MPTFAKARNLFRRRRTTVSSVDNVDSPPTTPVAPVGPPHLPRELAEEITGHLWNDRSTLRTLSLVSREFHRWSRTHLFTSVKFNLNQRFDSFLDLVESSEPTFGSLVRVLHLVALFSPRGVCRERTEESIRQLAAKLPNLKTVWLTSISWSSIPSHFLLLFIELKITHLQLESVIFYRPDQPKELFRWLPRSLEGITFDTIQFDGQRVEGSPDFYRDVHFRALDSTSLAIFRDVWDPAQRRDCKVTVKTLHMQLSALLWPVRREREIDFISQFLPQIGPSIRRLSIDLSSHSSQQEVLDIYETLDFSTCVNVNMIHIGVIELDKEEETRRVTATMWILLSSLPSPDQVDYIELTFAPRGEIGDTAATSLHGFPWLLAIMRLREMFRSLKRVTIRLGTWYNSGSRWTLQEAGLRTFEEVGFVKVENYRWPRSLNVEMPFYKLPWKESLNVF